MNEDALALRRENAADERPWSYVPAVPTTVADTRIPEPFLQELLLKTLRAYDVPGLVTLSEVTGLHTRVVQEVLDRLKSEGFCEIDAGGGIEFRYRLTDSGKAAAHEALERSRYIGIAPVPVSAYNDVVAEQVKRFAPPPLEKIKDALEHMVLSEKLVKDIGQAFFSRRTLMVFGPSGNGKTDIVTSIARTVAGTVIIPYALYGHGQLIRVFDPEIHKSQVEDTKESDDVWADESSRHDRRWLPVDRPAVVVGGEMGEASLEMSYDTAHGVHTAPLSIVAQGGVLVIDDLGRQKVTPQEILNRWVLMMAQGYDSFSLASSEVVRLPLDVTLVFSTNLSLNELLDEAYLRRIAYKIEIPNPDRAQLAEITRRFCSSRTIAYSEDTIQYMMDRLYQPGLTARGCYPRDIVTTIIDAAEFEGRKPVLDRESIDAACRLYLGTGALGETEAA